MSEVERAEIDMADRVMCLAREMLTRLRAAGWSCAATEGCWVEIPGDAGGAGRLRVEWIGTAQGGAEDMACPLCDRRSDQWQEIETDVAVCLECFNAAVVQVVRDDVKMALRMKRVAGFGRAVLSRSAAAARAWGSGEKHVP